MYMMRVRRRKPIQLQAKDSDSVFGIGMVEEPQGGLIFGISETPRSEGILISNSGPFLAYKPLIILSATIYYLPYARYGAEVIL